MKEIKLDSIVRGILMIAVGLIIAIFPDIFSKVFLMIGAAMIIYGIVRIIMEYAGDKNTANIIKRFGDIFVGFLLIILPNLVEFAVPVILGMIIAWVAVELYIQAFSLKNSGRSWIPTLAAAIIFTVAAVFLFFYPFKASLLFKRIFALILIAGGIVQLVKANRGSDDMDSDGTPGVINISSFSVKDD